jgi:hypothetical protein
MDSRRGGGSRASGSGVHCSARVVVGAACRPSSRLPHPWLHEAEKLIFRQKVTHLERKLPKITYFFIL